MTLSSWRRWLPLLALLVLGGAVWASGLHSYLNMATLQTQRVVLQRFVAEHQIAAPAIFCLVYAVVTTLSLPGAMFVTLAGGFLFGTWFGALWSVLGATAGAITVFSIARTACGTSLRHRAAPWLRRMESGFRKDAFSYLLVLRLIPLFPFWLVNLVPAFLAVPLSTFALASFLGIIPGALVYASAGSGLGAVLERGEQPDLGLILEPQILGPLLGLAALALLPVLYRRWKRRAPVAG
jgi:uncharacterized membrane protein YdjX (TVP38/TMEM64 family)